ncbi:MAG: hypothetical protein OXI50_03100 [Gammaproteobacteria bacterium]|nr:hypothetical protein [bacterium]MDE0473524.1 hypothetical protein [Gammaproteobacteria bacterium]
MARTLAEALSREELNADGERIARMMREKTERLIRQGPPEHENAVRLSRIEADMAAIREDITTLQHDMGTIRQAVLFLVERACLEGD